MKQTQKTKINFPLFYLSIFLLLMATMPGCTKKKEPSHEVLELDKRLKTAEESMVELEAKIKKAPVANQGLVLDLNNEKELAKARLDRLKMALEKLDPEFAANRVAGGAPAPAEHGGGGGHH